MALVGRLVAWIVVLAIGFAVASWFIGHAASAGSNVGDFFTAIFTFFRNLGSHTHMG